MKSFPSKASTTVQLIERYKNWKLKISENKAGRLQRKGRMKMSNRRKEK